MKWLLIKAVRKSRISTEGASKPAYCELLEVVGLLLSHPLTKRK